MKPSVSVIIPVYNEEDGLDALFARLYPALDALGLSYEIVFINDGSRDRSPAILRMGDVLGRSVLKNIEPGQALRQDDIRTRRWFAVGEPVRVTVKGSGFSASAEGMALSPGDEGQCAKIRFDSGRVVCGLPVGERQAEVSL